MWAPGTAGHSQALLGTTGHRGLAVAQVSGQQRALGTAGHRQATGTRGLNLWWWEVVVVVVVEVPPEVPLEVVVGSSRHKWAAGTGHPYQAMGTNRHQQALGNRHPY